MMNKILAWATSILAGVVTAETTLQGEPGATKLQKATDVATNELALAGQIVAPAHMPVIQAGANLTVAILNLIGLFSHKAKAPTPPAAG